MTLAKGERSASRPRKCRRWEVVVANARTKTTLVLGIGNTLLSDDGAAISQPVTIGVSIQGVGCCS